MTLPLLMPAVAGSALLVFMNALGSFSAPYVFGGGLRVLSTQILASKTNGALGLAYVETTVLALSAVAGLILFRWLDRKRKYTLASKGGRKRREIRSRRVQILTSIAAAAIVIALVLPHLMVVLVSFARDGAWTTQVLPPEYTFENYRRLFSESELWRPITNSVSMALVATVANLVVCFLAAYLIVFRRFRGRGLLELLVALPWAIPATAIALGLAATFNRNDLLSARILLVGTFWILPLAYFIRDIPLVASAVEGSLRQMDASLHIDLPRLGHEYFCIPLAPQNPSDRRCDIARRQRGGCYLIEQRLENEVVRSVDERDVDVRAPQRVGGSNASESAADDYDARTRPRVRQVAPRRIWLPAS